MALAYEPGPLWDEDDPLLSDAPGSASKSAVLSRSFEPAASDAKIRADGHPATTNGHTASTGSESPWTLAETDALIRQDPDEAARLLRGYHLSLGNGSDVAREDLRFGSIPATIDRDTRRYGIGLGGLTAHMGELRAAEFIVLGAREGHGKTAWAEKLVLANARDYKVLFATLEMTDQEIRDRILAKKLNYSMDRLSYERLEQTGNYKAALAVVSSYDLLIWQPAEKEQHVEAIIQRGVDVSADLLVIDHARCIGGWRSGNFGGSCDKIVNTLFKATRETSMTIVLLAQLNRDAAGRRPTNKHFQDTGFLEQKPDRCILLHRPFAGQESKDSVCEFIVSKNRKGPMFRAHTWWNGELMQYSSMDELDESNAPCCRKRGNEDEA